jgi:mono/diheme cytochrome c family protein
MPITTSHRLHHMKLPSWLAVAMLTLFSSTSAVAAPPLPADHAAKMEKGLALFKSSVRSVFVAHCIECHGQEETEGELDLTTREGLLHGGENGKVIVPGAAKESLLYKLINHKQEPEMPAEASKLKAAEIAAIAQWIDLGAPYDKPLINKSEDSVPWPERKISPDARNYWAFQPLAKVKPPQIKAAKSAHNAIDNFVVNKLEAKALSLNAPADRRVLIRRAYFDLIGMPPKPAEVDAFLSDKSPAAYSKVIDRLLASPKYGERWARHWLDLARFGESDGYEQDYDRKHAYHYRDFLIKALNQDMPYNQFVRWQLAGDEIAPHEPLAMMATGFLGAGAFPTQITENEFEPVRYDEMDDMLATTSVTMLGLSVGCARCHDHKFEPIPQADYYRMLDTFTKTIRSEHAVDMQGKEVTVMVSSEGLKPRKNHADGRGYKHFRDKTYFLKRGDVNQKQGAATQSFLQALMRGGKNESHWQQPPPQGWRTSYRRTALANWITDVEHGAGHLAARVIVNRLWQHHFGRGIVATPSDFGRQGDAPTHPELLDWLASELIRGGWKLKPVHKLMMSTAAYQQSSAMDPAKKKVDPENFLLWRYSPWRLEAEAVRDTLLAISGQLDERMYGAGTLKAASKRRSIYFTIKRTRLVTMMMLFDVPEPLVSQGRRQSTTIAPQALLLMNSPQVRQYAEALARTISQQTKTPPEQIHALYRAALGRTPNAQELASMTAFVKQQQTSYGKADTAQQLAIIDLCQAVMSLNEVIYVE